MPFIDFHCDTLMHTFFQNPPVNLEEDSRVSIDLKRLRKAGTMAQFFAIFLPPPEEFTEKLGHPVDDDDYIQSLLKQFRNLTESHPDQIRWAGDGQDLANNWEKGLISGFLTLEDGRSVQGSLERLAHYHSEGIRLISLTWNGENCFGYPNSKDPNKMCLGLKPFGKEAVEAMNELGMIVDVSHLSDGGFWDVADVSRKPFIASHSNCRALTPHQRNLTDEMIRKIGESGGVIGLNFAPDFLEKNNEPSKNRSCIDDMIRHLEHLKNVGGEAVVALGTDFDGTSGELEIDSVDQLGRLVNALKDSGWNDRQIELFTWRNAQRAILDILG